MGGFDDARLIATLDALERRLKRFEEVVLPELRRAAATGGLSEGQRAEVAKLLVVYP